MGLIALCKLLFATYEFSKRNFSILSHITSFGYSSSPSLCLANNCCLYFSFYTLEVSFSFRVPKSSECKTMLPFTATQSSPTPSIHISNSLQAPAQSMSTLELCQLIHDFTNVINEYKTPSCMTKKRFPVPPLLNTAYPLRRWLKSELCMHAEWANRHLFDQTQFGMLLWYWVAALLGTWPSQIKDFHFRVGGNAVPENQWQGAQWLMFWSNTEPSQCQALAGRVWSCLADPRQYSLQLSNVFLNTDIQSDG